jgi:hypothetical protein
MSARTALATATAAAFLHFASPMAYAQLLPSNPIVLGDGKVIFGGDVSATYGTDDPGFYTYTDYQHSALQRVRAGLSGVADLGSRLSLLGEVRFESGLPHLENSDAHVLGLYARVRPWRSPAFEVRAGRVPPTFGAFARRSYATDNPLIGYPLAYQYLTSLRPDALPANADELLRMRGKGWLSSFSVGNEYARHGLPLAAAFRWDTGIQVNASIRPRARIGPAEAGPYVREGYVQQGEILSATASVTTGTLANPLFDDDNGGRQFAGRVTVRPALGLVLGASAARGPFVSSDAARAATGETVERFAQTAWGADAEYSRGYYLIRFEALASRFALPALGTPTIQQPLRSSGASLEGRYKVAPGLYFAARVDRLAFSEISGSNGADNWDAPVTRVEVGGGYSLQRNLLLKVSYQRNTRDTTFRSRAHLTAAEVMFWF